MSENYTTADLLEDWHYARVDADMEMAEMVREGREIEAQRRRGECPHSSGYGRADNGEEYYPGQGALLPGQFRCTDICGAVIPDPFEEYR